MSKRVLYVGGLSEVTSEHQLRDLFSAYGAVTCAWVVRNKRSGKSTCSGFVEMGSNEQALSAVVASEGAILAGNRLQLYVTASAPTHA